MKKKFLLAGLMLIFSLSLSAASGKCGPNLTWDLTNGILTISGTGAMTNYTSSNSIPWYSDRTSIKTVIIENGVTRIGANAFINCSSLRSITIPNSVINIGGYAFAYCSSLTSINIPNSVTSIGDFAFTNCSSLPIIDNIRYADTYLVTAVDKTLSTYTIKEGTKWIGDDAFYGCSSLRSITIPNSVTSIGGWAFYDCSSLPVIDNLRYADTYLVGAVKNYLSTYTIKEGTKWIGTKAFDGCSSLTSITIPNSVTDIGWFAFDGCSSLTSIEIPISVTTIGSCAFFGCSSLTSITIPTSVTSIRNQAFQECSSLTSITIPNNVKSIGKDAFYNCSELKEVHISDIAKWCTISFENGDANPLYYAHNLYVNGSLVSDLVIPNSVTNICWGAFCGCSSLTSVTIPNSVTSIGNFAFYGCSGLTSATIPESVETIGAFPFDGCSNLTSVTWNAINCTTYDDGQYVYPPFQGCENITSFTIGENVQILPRGLCYGLPITSIVIPNKVSDIGIAAFRDCSSLTSVTLSNSVTTIEVGAFGYCSSLTSINIPNSVTTIGGAAFSGCSGLTSVTIGNGVTSIGGWAFYGCSELTDMIIPNKVTDLGERAFEDCTNLTTLTLGESITNYGDSVFNDCPKLTTIYNYRERPAKLGKGVFADVDYFNCTLYVVAGSVEMYKSAGSDWKDFYFVEPIGAAPATTEKVEITPSDNTADFVWPTVNNAASYELVIKDKQGNDVCTLIFDAQGHLTKIAFAAPDRNRAPEQSAEQVAGFSFTITGLNSGTTYDYTLTAKDAAGNVLDTKTGTFTTDGLTGIDDIPSSIDLSAPRKVLIDGQLYILLPNGTRYNLQGMEVK